MRFPSGAAPQAGRRPAAGGRRTDFGRSVGWFGSGVCPRSSPPTIRGRRRGRIAWSS